MGVGFEPELSYFRKMTTKVAAIIKTINDIYDTYGTLDELELFTEAVDRLAIDKYIFRLPNDLMKVNHLIHKH